jgi:hypothetical protein
MNKMDDSSGNLTMSSSTDDSASIEESSSIASIMRLRKGETKRHVKTWLRQIIKIEEKRALENQEAITQTKGIINYNRNLDSHQVSMDTFSNMKSIQGFEAQHSKAKSGISRLQSLLTAIEEESSEEFVAAKYEKEVLDLLSKPAVRPWRAAASDDRESNNILCS